MNNEENVRRMEANKRRMKEVDVLDSDLKRYKVFGKSGDAQDMDHDEGEFIIWMRRIAHEEGVDFGLTQTSDGMTGWVSRGVIPTFSRLVLRKGKKTNFRDPFEKTEECFLSPWCIHYTHVRGYTDSRVEKKDMPEGVQLLGGGERQDIAYLGNDSFHIIDHPIWDGLETKLREFYKIGGVIARVKDKGQAEWHKLFNEQMEANKQFCVPKKLLRKAVDKHYQDLIQIIESDPDKLLTLEQADNWVGRRPYFGSVFEEEFEPIRKDYHERKNRAENAIYVPTEKEVAALERCLRTGGKENEK
ncbi:MAG: hypothetical protein KKD18_02940 [Nanoarchaeota archaeon]|nr:hypothetical protein [Nanoarchaeota archaeon]MBU0977346.1 hypothetical protein [Nanoarchaeota archaeon]